MLLQTIRAAIRALQMEINQLVGGGALAKRYEYFIL